MSKAFVFVILAMACLCFFVEAQLTFTSSWGGKRGAIAGTLNCRSEESVASIYKLIQAEAERLLLCQKT